MTLRALWHALVGPPVQPPLFSPEVERRILLALIAVEANMAAMQELQRKQIERLEQAAATRPERRDDRDAAPRRRAPNEGFRRPPQPEPS